VSRVLLTGATGFVGRHALAALTGAGHEVHAITRRGGSDMAGRGGSDSAGVTWHEADLLAGCDVVGAIESEILIHLAWYAEHGKFWSSVENVRWVEASLALLRAFASAGGRRAVMAGTCAEYEWSEEVYREDMRENPATLYGASKHGLHAVARAWAQQAAVTLAWGRLFFLYGPGEARGRLVPSIVMALLHGEPAPMTDGAQIRDFLHVADAGAAFAALADSTLEGPVNIASGSGIALRELATMIAERTGGAGLLRIGELPDRKDDPASLVADVSRMRDELGYRPRIALGDGLDETVGYWRERMARPGAAGA
jgi:nucleoside-diphosphate-sugar epimerase